MDVRLILKVVLTAIVIVAISEIGKRSTFVGAFLASLPLTSLLAFMWLYIDNRENEPVAQLSMSIFWMVIPSLAFFPIFSILLRLQLSFWISISLSAAITAVCYYLFIAFLKHFGINF